VRHANIFLAAAAVLALADPAEAAERHRLNLPGGRLGPALVALGQQAGISIGVSDPTLSGVRVAPLRGTFTVGEALRRLLRGTGARAAFLDSSTVRIARLAPPVRPPAPRPAPRPAEPAQSGSPQPPPLPPEEATMEIVITATKRPVPIGAYPGPVTVVGGDDPMLRQGVPGTDALVSRVPSLTSTHLGAGRNKLFIRGIADSSFTGPTQATVGQYLGETRVNYSGPDPDLRLLDVDRVEVLAGPQGTLYGAGSMGGIVRLAPNPPRMNQVEMRAAIGASHTAHGSGGADVSAVVNVPLATDRLALRLLAYGVSEGGYIDDLYRQLEDVNRTRVFGGRAALRAQPAEGWTVDLGLAGQRIGGDDAQYASRSGPPLTRRTGTAEAYGNDYLLGQLVATRAWGDFRFVTAAGGVRQRLRERYDFSILREGLEPAVVDETQRVSLLSLETRLSRQKRDGTGWVLGAGLVRNRSFERDLIGSVEAPEAFKRIENLITEANLFGEVTVRLGAGIRGTAGGRFSHSRLSGPVPEDFGTIPVKGPPAPAEEEPPEKVRRLQNLFLPSAGLTAELGADLLLFARYQQAFRPGGIAFSTDDLQLFRPDKVAGMEAGLRFGAPGRGRFDAAVSAVYTRWEDVQADVATGFAGTVTGNIGDGRIYTLDFCAGWRPIRGLSLEAAVVLNDSLLSHPVPLGSGTKPIEGSKLPNVAVVQARFGAEYRTEVGGRFEVRLFGNVRYVGKSILGIGATLAREQGDWADVSVGASAGSGRHLFTIGVSNLLDAQGNRFGFGSVYTFLRDEQITPMRPRTIRLGYEVAF
jgi:outer membrane receptor protein involved in Fe transport